MTTVLTSPQYPFDPTGTHSTNRVSGELQPLTGVGDRDYYVIVPSATPFFASSMQLGFKSLQGETRPLVEGIDYYHTHEFMGATRATAKPVYASITLLNTELRGTLIFSPYQTLGGAWTVDTNTIAGVLAQLTVNPRTASWDQVAGYPSIFPPIPHEWNLLDLVGQSSLLAGVNRIVDAIMAKTSSLMLQHVNNKSGNVHGVTCTDIDAVSHTEFKAAVQRELGDFHPDTDNVVEGIVNKYFTQRRVEATLLEGLLVTDDISGLGTSDTLIIALAKLQAQLTAQAFLISKKVEARRPAFNGLGSQNLVSLTFSGSTAIDITQAEAFSMVMQASGAISFNTAAMGNMTGKVVEFSITTVNDNSGIAYAVAWPGNVKWVDGIPPPRSTAAAAKDFWYFVSEDNAVTWTGSLSNANPH